MSKFWRQRWLLGRTDYTGEELVLDHSNCPHAEFLPPDWLVWIPSIGLTVSRLDVVLVENCWGSEQLSQSLVISPSHIFCNRPPQGCWLFCDCHFFISSFLNLIFNPFAILSRSKYKYTRIVTFGSLKLLIHP